MKAIRKPCYQGETGLNLLLLPERKRVVQFIKVITALLLLVASTSASAQLGVYKFTGSEDCPTQNPAVASQPANALFSNFSSVNTNCKKKDDVCEHEEWNTTATIDLNEYHEFTLTANSNYTLVLTSLSFTHFVKDEDAGTTAWILRSSIDNYASDIATGSVLEAAQSPAVTLPAASFGSVSSVTFRIYIVDSKDNSNEWTIDDITLYGTVEAAPNDPPDPASDSPQCTNPGVTLTATGIPPAGETWYWQTSAGGTSTANSSSTYTVTTSGTYYIRAQDNTTLLWSNGAGSLTVTVTPDVGTPVFTLGASSTRCDDATTITYTATATDNTGITYSLDAASIAAGNTINSATGAVTYITGWTSNSIITATASGCNGPTASDHTVSVNPNVGVPVFTLGATSIRCKGGGTVTYTATATNTTGITYSLDAASIAGGITINAATGDVTYPGPWNGTTIITASAAGCAGPLTETHIVTTYNDVGTPVFALGNNSTRCQGAGTVTYSSTAVNSTSITYSLDAASLVGGNTINASTGEVTYAAGWSGATRITASAAGCNGPKTEKHDVTVDPSVGTPVFTLGLTSTRCQGANHVDYTASAANNTSLTYILDAVSLAAGNTINSGSGRVNYISGWTGTSIITATATGCNGPSTATHTATTTPSVTTPVFTLGATSTRCQGAGTVTYDATAANTTGITYSLNAAAIAGGNSINSSTGDVTYVSGWTGATIITASAAGCSGPLTATHTVTITPTVGTPVFTLGASSTRCQGAGTVTYSATATNNTGLTYSLDAASLAGSNTINSSTGAVTYVAGWTGSSIITITATGCNGPSTATHTVTTTPTVGTPVFTLGASSTRCQGAGTVTYTAIAANTTGILYSLDATTDAFPGNSINTSTGAVTYAAGWSGTSTITASAAGCNGPATTTHTVTTTPSVGTPVFTLGATSTRCQGAGAVSYTATATNTTGITYSLNAAAIAGGNSINSSTGDVTYVAGWTGATIITASAAGCNGPLTATHTVTITPTVGTPTFILGATSTRCQGAGTVTYTATATNNTGLAYSLDAASITGGNTINSSTGAVTYVAGWTGSSIITVTATGCNGPSTATHTVTITPTVGIPVFTLGASSTRCQGAGIVTYAATATNTTGITYSLDATTDAFPGNSINTSTGAVTYAAGWSGTSTITASAAGCGGPGTSTHTVTTTPTVGIPVFTLGATSSRCFGAGTVTYTATATNNTGITYSLDAASIAGSNTINAATGAVTYTAVWTGTSTITATATGCNGPRTSTHVVTINAAVTTPVFTLGASTTRCQGAATVTYTATASNTTGITYNLDAASIAGGNTINSLTGAVTYAAGWSGTTTITASAAGCNGPLTATHTVTITPTVGIPVFVLGASSSRCFGAQTINYSATSTNSTGITYSLDVLSLLGGCTINAATGNVTYSAAYFGNSTITASATGCNGPRTATHIVSVTPSVGSPVFTLGATSTRCQGAGTITYTATAFNTTGITYSLDAASLAGGNTINSSTGAVTYTAAWSGTTIVTASAAGCNGPLTSTHTVTITPTVGIPVFTLGANSTRCQGANIVTYTATSTNSTGITYTLDAASLAAGNTINSASGAVVYTAGWTGTSTITATAAGCNGPVTGTHTATTTPTVGTPVFTLGANSTRCQGAGTVTYTATATNTTGITYSLDAASLAGGNTINSSTGIVTYAAAWSGASTITSSAAGCNGPITALHTVTITASVTTPVFLLGSVSTRLQGAGTVTYTATASNSTGITYTLDAASIAGGNTINSSTGEVTYSAGWGSTTIITASAAGCGGPKTATHTVMINSNTVVKQLYLSDPAQALDRVDPVNTTDATTASTGLLSTSGTTFTTFTMAPVLCSSLTIKAGTISVKNYITVSSGTMPANPAITALLQYGATTIITLSNPTYAGGILTWTGVLGADVIVPAGQAITLRITTAEPIVIFRIDFDSQTKPSKIDLPVSTYINITSLDVYSAAYPGGIPVYTAVGGTTKYIRATVTDPFGTADITALNITITPPGSTVAAASVATAGCTRTYEYVWNTPAINGTVAILATAKEGFENSVVNTRDINFDLCTSCPPVAVNDSATGAGGTPVIVDALANDNDANNNLNPSSLSILVQPNNGSAYVSGNTVVYVPNGTFQGKDTLTYRVCDLTSPVPLCATAQIFFTIDALVIDICGDASKTHTYYIPYPEDQSFIALNASASAGNKLPTNNLRTIISIKVPYSGMVIRWDEWEDGYEANILSPVQATTKVWGDGNPFNGIAPGYGSDVIPAGGSIILDNTMNANPRNPAIIYYDGKDKIVSSGQVALTQVSGEPTLMPVQAIKTNITSVYDFGQSFTVPLGEDFNSRDFLYTALFIRASEDNTTVSIDKDNNGTLETSVTLNEGQSFLLNGGVLTGATVTSDKPVGVELNAGGVDNYSIRNAPIFPATWYSHTYYTPVPTSDNAGDNPKDSSVVMFYNSLAFKTLTINWSSGAPASGTITIPPKTAIRFPLAYSTTAAYKFVNPTGESYTAIEIIDSYTPGGGGNSGLTYDWSFNLISEVRLTDYATVAWAPGGLDLVAPPGPDVNGNPIWVTPTSNTTIYVKYDGIISGASGLVSPCGLKYDVSYNVNALNYIKIKDPSDNDQGGIAIYTCNGAKIAAAYGEDPQGSATGVGVAYWDVGSTIQPFCKQKLLIATDDLAATLVNQPVTIPVLNNDIGFLAVVNPSSVSTLGLLQPSHGTVSINADGTILYIPNTGFAGVDSFEYNVCSTPSPIVCDVALVVVNISSCPSTGNQNIIAGQIFIDRNNDALNNDGGTGLAGIKVLLYTDGNCNAVIDANELTDSVTVDSSGFYQFIKYPEKIVEDNFDNGSGGGTCANGSDGDSPWASNWVDAGDGSVGYCQGAANPDAEITRDGVFGFGLRLKDNNVSATRSVNLNGAIKAFLTFSYRRKSATLAAGEDISVQASSDGSTFFTIYTIAGNGTADANYLTVYNQDISGYATANTAIRFLTNNNVDDQDTVYIDNVAIRFLKYPQCFITRIDPASVPAGYTITTPSQKTLTFTNGGTCSSQFDFGFKKPNITISGSVRNDKNGVKDGLITGPKIGTLGGTTIYAYLTDFSGNVAFKTTVNGSGDFSFPLAEVNADYTLILSTINVSLGAAPPASSGCPASWGNVGDSYGINNLLGTGLETGTPDGAIAIKTGAINVTNVEFGFQRIPNSDNYIASVNHPAMNQLITLNGGANPPVLSGSDPEDCTSGCVLTARDVIIDTIPNNAELYYNNALITNGQLISNFDPNLLQVRVTAATLGDTTITFNYSFVDDAVMKDLTPATYKLIWLVPLPSKGLTASANLNNNTATIKWFTLSEQNTSHFVVERKYGNSDFTATGNQVRAAGNSDFKRDYQMPDNIGSLMQNEVIYYRVKLVDLDGKVTYSNTVIIRLSKKPGVTIWPNPFQSSLTISITTEKETIVDIKLIDVNGKLIRNFNQKVAKGISQIAVQDLAQLPAGVYLIEITDKNAGTTYQKLLKNNR